MDWDIRPMGESDLGAVAAIECAALGLAPTDGRNLEFLKLVHERNAKFFLVAERNKSVCGAIVAQKHGATGFIGFLVVQQDATGKGIAGALLDHAVAALSPTVEFIGIQIPPDCTVLTPLLIKHGFQFVEPQVVLRANAADLGQSRNAQPARGTWRDFVGLAEWAEAMEKAKLGVSIRIANEHSRAGAALVELAPRRTTSGKGSLVVSVGGAWRTLGGDQLTTLLQAAAEVAQAHQRTNMFVAVNGVYQRELDSMLKNGWSVVRLTQRLVCAKTLSRYRQFLAMPQVDLTQWTI